jgi:hypothetical protein
MDTYPLPIGEITYRITSRKGLHIDPQSDTARSLANEVALQLMARLAQAVLDGKIPPYAIRAEVGRIEAGSLLVTLALFVDVANIIGGAVVGAGLVQFFKDYADVRNGVQQCANDVADLTRGTAKLPSKLYLMVVHRAAMTPEETLQRDVASALAKVDSEAARREAAAKAEAELRAAEESERARLLSRNRGRDRDAGVPS